MKLEKLHVPVGGRRFRPSLEGFIELLRQEKLLPKVKSGWRKVLEDTRGDWEARQVRAAVRRSPDHAADQLRQMGYRVGEVN